jgi:hypothetical protein
MLRGVDRGATLGVAVSVCLLVGAPARQAAACDDSTVEVTLLGVARDGSFAIERRTSPSGADARRTSFSVHDRDGAVLFTTSHCTGAECPDGEANAWNASGSQAGDALHDKVTAGNRALDPAGMRRRIVRRLGMRPARRSPVTATAVPRGDESVAVHLARPRGAPVDVGEKPIAHPFSDMLPAVTFTVLERAPSPQVFVHYAWKSEGGGCSARYQEILWVSGPALRGAR